MPFGFGNKVPSEAGAFKNVSPSRLIPVEMVTITPKPLKVNQVQKTAAHISFLIRFHSIDLIFPIS